MKNSMTPTTFSIYLCLEDEEFFAIFATKYIIFQMSGYRLMFQGWKTLYYSVFDQFLIIS